MKIRISIFFAALILLLNCAGLFSDTVTDEARKYFNELKSIADKDNKKLWGEYLYGPVMFVNPRTREIITNENDVNKTLLNINGVYIGKLSDKDILANTAYNWHGKIWTMILMPLPKSDYDRHVLMVHEAFHRIQGRLGLESPGETNNQLDDKLARILLRLEWEALLKALNDSPSAKQFDIQSALTFREMRRREYPGSTIKENAMEIHEGLAEYTGIKLGIADQFDRIRFIAEKVSDAGHFPSLVRSFPYESGPLYCLLLDQSNTDWRQMLNKNTDFGILTKKIFNITLEPNLKLSFEQRKNLYRFKEIEEYENGREIKKKQVVNDYKKIFVSGRKLIASFVNMKIQFDPRNLIALDNYGTVYPTLKIVDDWGILEVSKGALITSDWKKVIVSYPMKIEGNSLTGDGWQLTLNNGWNYYREGDNLKIGR